MKVSVLSSVPVDAWTTLAEMSKRSPGLIFYYVTGAQVFQLFFPECCFLPLRLFFFFIVHVVPFLSNLTQCRQWGGCFRSMKSHEEAYYLQISQINTSVYLTFPFVAFCCGFSHHPTMSHCGLACFSVWCQWLNIALIQDKFVLILGEQNEIVGREILPDKSK